MLVKNEKELGCAIRDNVDTIEIEGDLAKKVVRIKATGKVVWVVAIGAIGVAVASIALAPASGGASTAAGFIATPVAVGGLGVSVTACAVSIAVAAGGVGALNKLRKYKLEKKSDGGIVLRK